MSRAEPKVALVHDWLTGMRGGEKVLELMAERFPEAPIFTLFHFEGSVSAELESHSIRTTFLQRFPSLRRHYRNYLPLFPRAIESFDFSGFDLVLSTSHCVAKGILTPSDTPHLCYCHTPMRYVWDQQRVYFPKSNHPIARVRDHLLSRLRRWDQRTAGRPTRYLANSTFVRERIERYYDRSAEVLHPPVDTAFFCPADDDPDSPRAGLVCVAALNPYKRIDLAIRAAATLDVPITIVGSGPDRNRLRRLAEQLGCDARFRSGIDGHDLRELYRSAQAFVQPGIEDFGIASVEALACGTPVVAASEGGVLDIVRPGQDGILFAPRGECEALVDALERLETLDFDRQALSQRAGRFAATEFTRGLGRHIDELL